MAKNGLPDILTIGAKLTGVMPIMFSRYPGDNKTKLSPEKMMYFAEDGKTLVIPRANIMSFLCAQNTDSAVKMFGGKGYKNVAKALLGMITISLDKIPLTRSGKPIVFSGFSDGVDKVAKIHVEEHVARLAKGIPNPVSRPVVELPWDMSFEMKVFKNEYFDETFLKSLFVKGGLFIGFGAFRGLYGKFVVDEWKMK